MKKMVVAVSRSYGSGGELIGEKLAAGLGIPVYDKAIIEMAAEKSGLSSDYIDKLEEHASSSFLFNLVSTSYNAPAMLPQYDVPISYTAFSAQVSVIRELAERGSCVIVGRCSEYILRDDPECVKVFIYADREQRLQYVMKMFKLDRKTADAKLTRIDKGRSNYYKNFTGENWGSVYNHDLSINATRTGISGAVEVIKSFLHETQYI